MLLIMPYCQLHGDLNEAAERIAAELTAKGVPSEASCLHSVGGRVDYAKRTGQPYAIVDEDTLEKGVLVIRDEGRLRHVTIDELVAMHKEGE